MGSAGWLDMQLPSGNAGCIEDGDIAEDIEQGFGGIVARRTAEGTGRDLFDYNIHVVDVDVDAEDVLIVNAVFVDNSY